MGWLFGWDSRKQLVEHLLKGNGVKTIKQTSVGTNLWCVHEIEMHGQPFRFACLYLIKGPPYGRPNDRDGWGYKDVSEDMGPSDTSFPYTWLDLLSPIDSQYANDWRAAVRARGEKARQMKVGSKWKWGDEVFTIIRRRSPSSFVIETPNMRYRVPLNWLLSKEPA